MKHETRWISARRRSGTEGLPADVELARPSIHRDTAERLAHTVKGVAGNIGAEDLQSAGAELEARADVELRTDAAAAAQTAHRSRNGG